MGGTGIIGRVIQMHTGMPLSQVYLWTDGTIVLVAGLVFGWETALYAMLTLFLGGLATDYVLEGPSAVRTATIITENEHREEMAAALIDGLGRGVSHWEITGGYTGQPRTMLLLHHLSPPGQRCQTHCGRRGQPGLRDHRRCPPGLGVWLYSLADEGVIGDGDWGSGIADWDWDRGLGIGDWGSGIGDWGSGNEKAAGEVSPAAFLVFPILNPQPLIPNPQSPTPTKSGSGTASCGRVGGRRRSVRACPLPPSRRRP